MKKTHLSIVAAIALISVASGAFAEGDTSPDSRGEGMVVTADSNTGTPGTPASGGKGKTLPRGMSSSTKPQPPMKLKSNLDGKRLENMKKQGERVIERLAAALKRLQNIAERLDSRIKKSEEKGFDTVKAKADLVIAKAKIEAAKTKLDAAKTAIANIILGTDGTATTTPGEILSGKIKLIKEQVRIVEEALKEAHKALVQATTDLKGKSGDKTATTTKASE
ncbi:MAG: hypothetical protein HYT94_05635 [Parcubacteria group bacterium]|nr:hypothetical protein [Parcubacteria group bacterium]